MLNIGGAWRGETARPAVSRHIGDSHAPALRIARRGHRAPGARSRLKAGSPSPCRHAADSSFWGTSGADHDVPLVLGACVGLALAIIGLQLPGWLDKTLSTLGAAAVPTALVASGMAISLAEVRQHAGEVLWILGK